MGLGILAAFCVATALAEPVAVRQMQGAMREFFVMRSEQGKVLAEGEFSQQVHGDRITAHLVYRFHDGSVDDETTVFTQHGTFELVSDRHIQRGPYFPKPTDFTVEAATGTVTSRSTGRNGKEKVEVEHKDIPSDLYNGMVGLLLLNVSPNTAPFKVSYLAPIGKGRIIALSITRDGTGSFTDAVRARKATIFRVKIDLGGVTGAIAPLFGKQPHDVLVWVSEGDMPALVREVTQLYEAPTVSIELSGISFRSDASAAR